MKSKKAVIFPDTVPREQVLTPLLLVFEQVVYCQPIENDDSREALSPLCEAMVDHSLCDIYVPAPLAEHRERFLKLVHDLRDRRDDYAAQLTHVSLAGISSGSQTGSETRSSILSNLLSGHGIDSDAQEMIEKLLWQARLILKLGEQYDIDQQKMAEDMHTIQQQEQELFSGMVREEGNSPFSLTGKLTSLTADTGSMQRLRLKAWARIFALASTPFSGNVFVSTDPDAVDRLCEEYERSAGIIPENLVVLQLPVSPGKEGYIEQLHHFKEDNAELLNNLAYIFDKPARITEEKLIQLNSALEKSYQASEYGRCQLTLYKFSGVRIKQLFLDSYGHDEDKLETELADEIQQDFLVGLLAQQ